MKLELSMDQFTQILLTYIFFSMYSSVHYYNNFLKYFSHNSLQYTKIIFKMFTFSVHVKFNSFL